MDLKRKEAGVPFIFNETGLPVLLSPRLAAAPGMRHCFTTRLGGVSSGIFSTMNFRRDYGDREENIRENYRRVGLYFEEKIDRIVISHQTHTTNIRLVTGEDAGKGVTRPLDYDDVDGLITNVPGLVLGVFSADCVPILLYDPVHKAAGAIHSGWRGTIGRIGAKAVQRMGEEYGTKAGDLLCAIGPSICQDCYEVSGELSDRFRAAFPGHEDAILRPGREGHFQLDLWEACRIGLMEAGVPIGQIDVTDICTRCNPDLLFSHRATGGKRGVNGSFIQVR